MIKNTLYARYIHERRGLEVLETEQGFITYKFAGAECFIEDMFVIPMARSIGIGRSLIGMLREIARGQGCKVITANIHLNDPGHDNTLTASLLCGFEVVRAEFGVLLISKKVEE